MKHRHPQRPCPCARSYLPHSTTLLFLSLVLPATSFAQLTTSSLTPTSRSPTTLSTSTVPSSTILPSSTQSTTPPPSATPPPNSDNPPAFHYYFLIIAAGVIFVSLCALYIGRQKRRKAALAYSYGQRALARDVEGWRSRFGVGRAGAYNNTTNDTDVEDGLNERGEAPPPYVPGSKPPSIGSEELRRPSTSASSHLHSEPVELTNLSPKPPGYNEHASQGSANESADITRPGPVIIASERVGSVRRLESSSTGNTGA